MQTPDEQGSVHYFYDRFSPFTGISKSSHSARSIFRTRGDRDVNPAPDILLLNALGSGKPAMA